MDQSIKSEGRAGATRARIIQAATGLFAERGFDATSIRDIAAAVGMTTAALYYHFPSKEALFVVVHGLAMQSVTEAVLVAVAGITDPWDRIEAAAMAHCATLLGSEGNKTIIMARFAGDLAAARETLVWQRDEYENMIAALIDDLALPATVDRKILRLHLLGALNSMPNWYSPGGSLSAAAIGREIVRHIRRGLDIRQATGRLKRDVAVKLRRPSATKPKRRPRISGDALT